MDFCNPVGLVVLLCCLGIGLVAAGPCDSAPCENNGQCKTIPAGWECTCAPGYEGERCENEADECASDPCENERACVDYFNDYYCSCGDSFYGQNCEMEYTVCSSDPCENDGICSVPVQGSPVFKCDCKLGYVDTTCKQNIMKNCEDVKSQLRLKGMRLNDDFYYIDPDGHGDLKDMKVYCILEGDLYDNDIAITEVRHDFDKAIATGGERYSWTKDIDYDNDVTLEQMRALIDNSQHCQQHMRFYCKGVDVWSSSRWLGGDEDYHTIIGDAYVDKTCACKLINACHGESGLCNCDKEAIERMDSGQIRDSSILPVMRFEMGGIKGSDNLEVFLHPLQCAETHFNYPKNCKEALLYMDENVKNDVVMIDIDGPDGDADGNLDPFLVHCDFETYSHVQLLEIPHYQGKNGKIGLNLFYDETREGYNEIKYAQSEEVIEKLKKTFDYCYQHIGYQCKDSGLMGQDGGYWSSQDGTRRNYWGSTDEQDNFCACGVIGMCEDRTQTCDCNIKDHKIRYDFGALRNKDHLPVGSVTVKSDRAWDGYANFYVGWFACANRPFGFEPSCQWYRYSTRVVDKSLIMLQSYTYLIDPDGPIEENPTQTQINQNIEAFPVYCEFASMGVESLLGISRTPPRVVEQAGHFEVSYGGIYKYNLKVLKELVRRSVYCTQEITYSCSRSPIHRGSNQVVYWENVEGERRNYFHGTGGDACFCNGKCHASNNNKCNCDANINEPLQDTGTLYNKDDLPVTALYPQDGGEFHLGGLKCYEVYESCHKFYDSYRPLETQSEMLIDGRYSIDPDGPTGVDPFGVYCRTAENGTIMATIISIVGDDRLRLYLSDNPEAFEGPYKVCLTLDYGASIDKLRALSEVSTFCHQEANFKCMRAPITTHMKWKDREGIVMEGWAGNLGGTECMCGEVNRCAGGIDAKCNCDMNDGEERWDGGLLIDKEHLPITEICAGFDENQRGKERLVDITVSEFVCRPEQIIFPENCQIIRSRDGKEKTMTYLLDPDGIGGVDPTIGYCEMTYDPPVGTTEYVPVNEDCSTDPVTDHTYLRASMEQIKVFQQHEQYCRQDVVYKCTPGATFAQTDLPEWRDASGRDMTWKRVRSESVDDGICPGEVCTCEQDGYLRMRLWEQTTLDDYTHPADNDRILPIIRVQKETMECVKLGTLFCYEIFQDCHEVYTQDYYLHRPLSTLHYAIDPDQMNGDPLFRVLCDFDKVPDGGVTIIPHDVPKTAIPTVSTEFPLKYESISDINQVIDLVKRSVHCQMNLEYFCKGIPLLNDFNPAYAQLTNRDGVLMREWWGSDNIKIVNEGCACRESYGCPLKDDDQTQYMCRCDMFKEYKEKGKLINRDFLPILKFQAGGPLASGMASGTRSGYIELGALECGSEFFDFDDLDCDALKERHMPSGEFYQAISGDRKVPPKLLSCDFENSNSGQYDECLSEPCLNDAYCADKDNMYICFCSEGWTGTHCENNLNDCGSDPCQHGGTCIDDLNAYECVCPDDYEGIHCEANIDDCDDDPCLNDGNCTDGFNSFTCDCIKGFEGLECQINTFGCGKYPCTNGAACREYVNDHKCDCLQGFSGKYCEINEDECESAPCVREGVCLNLNGSFECMCQKGYGGVHCEMEINECDSNPCEHNGTCIDGLGEFTCKCGDTGYGGPYCHEWQVECLSKPCLNGGWCINLEGSYRCDCDHTDFVGRICSVYYAADQGATTTPKGYLTKKKAEAQMQKGLPPDTLLLIFIVMGISDFFIVACTLVQFLMVMRRYKKRKKKWEQLHGIGEEDILSNEEIEAEQKALLPKISKNKVAPMIDVASTESAAKKSTDDVHSDHEQGAKLAVEDGEGEDLSTLQEGEEGAEKEPAQGEGGASREDAGLAQHVLNLVARGGMPAADASVPPEDASAPPADASAPPTDDVAPKADAEH